VASAQSFESITIHADGSVEPSTAPITRKGNVYTLTEDIQGSITVEKSNIIVNGAGHTLKRDQQTRAISLHDVNKVVIMNFKISAASHTTNSVGIFLSATNSTIANNIVTDNACGIWVYSGSDNVIAGNNVTRNFSCGIELDSNNNTVIGNYITSTTREPNNWMFGVGGININSALNNRITENQIANNSIGIHFLAFAYFAQSGERKGDNHVYRNNFIDNHQTVLNEALFSEVMVNIWDDGASGNHWSDYGGKDEDGDGVGDTPYAIDDLNQDNFPLMAPVEIPTAPVALPGAPLVMLLNPVNMTTVT
jgi:parallel beta-helix repeat protein